MLKEIINRILQWIFEKKTPPPKPYHPVTNPLSVDKIAKELNIESEAERLGSANIPPTDSTTLSGIEAQIIQVVQRARQDYVNWAKDRLSTLNNDINRLSMSITSYVNDINAAKTSFENKVNTLHAESDSLRNSLALNVQKREAEFNSFKEINKLDREPHYPKRSGLILRIAILISLIVFEGAVNAVFFQKGIWGGLVQGFLYAAIFAFINVLIASFFGHFLISQINHISIPRKMLGILFIMFTFIIAAVISLSIAHYRDVLGIDPDNAARIALGNLRNNSFGLKEVHSWLLFILSLFFAIGACIDTYSMDDKYPGYGKIHKQLEQAREDYETEIIHIRTKLEDLKKLSLDALEKTLNNSRNDLMQLYEAIQNKSSTKTTLDAAFNDTSNCKTALLSSFRSFNQMHRSTPAPQYFNNDYILTDFPIPDFSTTDDEEKYVRQQEALQAIDPKIIRIKEDIQAAFVKENDKIPSNAVIYGAVVGSA